MEEFDIANLQKMAKERSVRTQSIEYDLETLVKKINKNVIKLDPDYQRRHRWNELTSARLIESLILNIPIPIIYLSYDIDVDTEEEGARYSVIDGQQRLTAIRDFFQNKFPLNGLEILKDLQDCYYRDLPPFLHRRLEDRTIKCLRVDSTIDQQVKYDIFERLNTGSVKLESHELRNAIYRGPFNDLCKDLSKDENYRTLLQIPIDKPENNPKVKKMEDVEHVLRFCSLLNDNYKNFKKTKDTQFKDFLSLQLEDMNKLTSEDINHYSHIFKKTMILIREVFGDAAFSKYKIDNNNLKRQSKFNVAVFDALSIAFASEVDLDTPDFNENIVEKFKNLFFSEDFYESISGSYLDVTKIIYRINTTREIFR